MKFSVVLCTYNTDEDSLRFTLDSLVNQSIGDYEIIVCDDGSADNHRAFLEAYFAAQGIEQYRLLLSPVNRGTVQNLLAGLEEARGEYVKPIGAGDALADRETLERIWAFMREKRGKLAFGKLRAVSVEDGARRVQGELAIPMRLSSYERRGLRSLKRNLVAYGDNISGAQLFYDTAYLRELLLRMTPGVKYMEDFCTYLAVLDGEEIAFFPETVVLYEVGSGLSTSPTEGNLRRLAADRAAFLQLLKAQYPRDPELRRRLRMEKIDNTVPQKALKALYKFLADPRWLAFRLALVRVRLSSKGK